MIKLILVAIGLTFVQSAMAEKIKEYAKADTAARFQATAKSIRDDLEKGGRFEFVTPMEKATAIQDLERMTAILEKSGSVSAMTMQDKVALFNLQEHLNGILTRSDSDRLVCERNSNIGSNIPTTTCKTFGEIQRLRRDTQDVVNRNTSHDPQLQNGWCPSVTLGTNMAAACGPHGRGGN